MGIFDNKPTKTGIISSGSGPHFTPEQANEIILASTITNINRYTCIQNSRKSKWKNLYSEFKISII